MHDVSCASPSSRNAQKRAARRQQKKKVKEVAVNELLLEKKRLDCRLSDDIIVNRCNAMQLLPVGGVDISGGGKAYRVRRARNGESVVGTCADHRPTGNGMAVKLSAEVTVMITLGSIEVLPGVPSADWKMIGSIPDSLAKPPVVEKRTSPSSGGPKAKRVATTHVSPMAI